jgi:hypothetical protein
LEADDFFFYRFDFGVPQLEGVVGVEGDDCLQGFVVAEQRLLGLG